MTGKPPQAER